MRNRFSGEKRPQPLPQRFPFGLSRLIGVGRRHLSVGDNLGHTLPHIHPRSHVGKRVERCQVDVPLDDATGMAVVAIPDQERSDP